MCSNVKIVDEVKSNGNVVLCFFLLSEIGDVVEVMKWLSIEVFIERKIVE